MNIYRSRQNIIITAPVKSQLKAGSFCVYTHLERQGLNDFGSAVNNRIGLPSSEGYYPVVSAAESL